MTHPERPDQTDVANPRPATRVPGAGIARALSSGLGEHTTKRYGRTILHLSDGRPERVERCLLPDGTFTDARCVAPPPEQAGEGDDAIDPTACVWLRPLREAPPLARRGRLRTDPTIEELRFTDETDAGEEENTDAAPSLERDLVSSATVRERARSPLFAELLYASLTGTLWRHRATGEEWACTMRHAGAVAAGVRGEGDYLNWYCSGGEEHVDEGVLAAIEEIGWELIRDRDG